MHSKPQLNQCLAAVTGARSSGSITGQHGRAAVDERFADHTWSHHVDQSQDTAVGIGGVA